MNKWESIALIIIAVAIFGGLAINNVYKSKASIEKAKMGLEECPVKINGIQTIWVKDCIAYTKALK